MQKKQAFKSNLIFAAILLAAAGVAAYFLAQRATGATAVLTYGDSQTLEISLAEDQRYDLQSNGYTIHLVVEDGSVRFVDSPCPDHLCEGYGRLSQQDDWAACLPARASVIVNG